MILSTSNAFEDSILTFPGGQGFGIGEKLAGFYLGKETIQVKDGKDSKGQDIKKPREVLVFRSAGKDGCFVEHGRKFKVFSSGLMAYQIDTGIPKLFAENGLELPKIPYIIMENFGKQKMKNKPALTPWKIECQVDLDMKAEEIFGMRDAFDNDESSEPAEGFEKTKDSWEVEEVIEEGW